MRKIIILLFLVFITNNISAQITKLKTTKNEEILITQPYDSLNNFLGSEAFRYLNQELYLNELPEGFREYGYDDFVIDYLYKGYNRRENIYKCNDLYSSKYDDLKGRYFFVKAIHKHPKAEKYPASYERYFYLELEEKESNDKVFFLYDSKSEHLFPFLVVGFYEKQKRRLLGENFVFSNKILEKSPGKGKNILTGNPFIIKTGEKWKCTDLTIEQDNYNLVVVVESSSGETTTLDYDLWFTGKFKSFTFTAEDADRLKVKLGAGNFQNILQGKVKIGMTKEMCALSWGEPNDINQTILSDSNSEQWVYRENYLYFDGNNLTAIQ